MAPSVRLRPGRQKSLARRHPWIFSGAIGDFDGNPSSGETVEVVCSAGTWLARGAYSPESQIRVRVWTWDEARPIDSAFFKARLTAALARRTALAEDPETDAYREVHGESDGLPGLIVDRYGSYRVTQFLSACAERWRESIEEALFSLGDKPEARFAEHRAVLRRLGHRTTLEYLAEMCAHVVRESSLLPHVNPGVMSERDLSALRELSVSMGIMLETASDRLLGPGLAHDRAPDKVPARRLRTIALAGKLQIPFTTGILIGIGETHAERVDALLAILGLHERYGHIQEVIVQNFRAKPATHMRAAPDPTLDDLLATLAVARLLLGGGMNNVFWYQREFLYTLSYQKQEAPLIFVIAGTGSSFYATSMIFLQKVF